MSHMFRNPLFLAAAATLAASLPAAAWATPADPQNAKDWPVCSAKVTDSCIQREGAHHMKARHTKVRHHRAVRRHHS